MKKFKSALIYILILAVLASFAGCNTGKESQSVAEPDSNLEDSANEEVMPEENEAPQTEPVTDVTIKIGTLKGPTGIGAIDLIEKSANGETNYEFSILDSPEIISPMIIKGELDIAAVPVNLASVLYNKTEKGVSVIAVNTLGVISVLTNGEEISSVADLKGKEISATGQGATPEYILNYVLSKNGIDPAKDVTIEYKSEHAELAALLIAGEANIAVLPEPFVTTSMMTGEDVKIALDLTEEWQKASEGTPLTTGCLIVRNDFLNNNREAVDKFLEDYKNSIEFVNTNIDEASALVEKHGIIGKAAIAKAAIPRCNIVFLDGEDMQKAVSAYLNVLLEANPASVGGGTPDEEFYYKKA